MKNVVEKKRAFTMHSEFASRVLGAFTEMSRMKPPKQLVLVLGLGVVLRDDHFLKSEHAGIQAAAKPLAVQWRELWGLRAVRSLHVAGEFA